VSGRIPPLLTAAEWAAMSAEMDRELRYWADHRDELLAAYPNHFVAVQDGQVVATDTDLVHLLDVLKAHGIDPAQTWTRFISGRRHHLV
jgi:hypothetical protein